MKTYASEDLLDAGEVEARKRAEDYDLSGIKLLGMNLIDEHQAYVFIQDEDGEIVSTIQDLRKLYAMVRAMCHETTQTQLTNERREP